ncbi:MAG: alpha/beta hydrolase [Candidatus Bathyarchaeota archaeon]|nr:alpha/beta hydrolase [Candidatus Bathyarchaeota archaeon]
MVATDTKNEEAQQREQAFSLPDGRQLAYCTVGEGKPVLYFHGTASSRLETLLLKELAFTAKLQIIGIDRPGYGLSTYAPRRNLSDFACDVNLLTKHLGLESAAVLGWSGGGVFALAYAALFPERVTNAVVVGAPALPFDVSTAHNNPLARYAMKVPYIGMLALRQMRAQVLKANENIDAFLGSKEWEKMLKGCSKEDVKFFSNRTWLSLLYRSMAEAFRQGDKGVKAVLQEHQLFTKTWDIPLSRIPPDKVFVWQGAEDKTCRVENAFRIARDVPGARLEVFEGKGHCVMFDYLEKLGEILRS